MSVKSTVLRPSEVIVGLKASEMRRERELQLAYRGARSKAARAPITDDAARVELVICNQRVYEVPKDVANELKRLWAAERLGEAPS